MVRHSSLLLCQHWGHSSTDLLKPHYWSRVPARGCEALCVLGRPGRWAAAAWSSAMALMRPPKQDVLCYPYLLGGTGPMNVPPNKTFFLLTIIGYVLNPITSLSNFARIPLDRQVGFGCAITNLQRNNRFLQQYTSLLDIHKGLVPGFDILHTLLI